MPSKLDSWERAGKQNELNKRKKKEKRKIKETADIIHTVCVYTYYKE